MCTILKYKLKSPAVAPVHSQGPLRLIVSTYVKGWLAFTWQKNQEASQRRSFQNQSRLHDYKLSATQTSGKEKHGEKK